MSSNNCLSIQVDPNDNVAVVVSTDGLPAGCLLADSTELRERIPQGHKVALTDIAKDVPVLRYGEVIGFAREAIARGRWINEAMLRMPEAPTLDDLPLATRKAADRESLEGYTFEGYRNADGSVGTRNILGIPTSVQCVAGVTNHVVDRIKRELLPRYPNVDDVVALNHGYGCGVAIDAPAAIVPIRTLQLAAGMNMHLFTTGRGTPYGLALVPVIKVATNSRLARQWFDLIDVDAGRIATGDATIEAVGWEIFRLILAVASGHVQVAADRLGLRNDLVLFNPAPVT
ncbi:MAG: UxaA family hydrolase [Gammaproteobacteria bacterium]|nr:UxaA family hydrolase [Gammaproteobacteria bacterium]